MIRQDVILFTTKQSGQKLTGHVHNHYRLCKEISGMLFMLQEEDASGVVGHL